MLAYSSSRWKDEIADPIEGVLRRAGRLNIPGLCAVFHRMSYMRTSDESKLRRQNGMIAGICGGLGEFFGIRAFWFRLLFLLLAVPGGFPGVLTYLVLWLIVPKRM